MAKNIKRGLFRVWVLAAILWVGAMGYYQYNEAQKPAKDSITISLSKDSQFRIDENGITKVSEENKSALQMQRISIVLLPPLVLLALFPVGTWLARGFKSESK